MKSENIKIEVGMVVELVLLPDWGHGRIKTVTGDILTIDFEKVGEKMFDSSITPLKVLHNGHVIIVNHHPSPVNPLQDNIDINYFACPDRVFSFEQLVETPPPCSSGVYGWYFKELPPCVTKDGCTAIKTGWWPFRTKWWLLYIGQADDLRDRIVKYHIEGGHYAKGTMSSFRLSIGCLLSKKYSLILHYPPESFGKREKKLNRWLTEHVRVAWIEVSEDHLDDVELAAIRKFTLPLNHRHNLHPLKEPLSELRSEYRKIAKSEKPRSKEFKKAYNAFLDQLNTIT